MKYHFKIHKEGNGYWAECLELPGCLTQADSKEELLVNMHEALNLYVSEAGNSKYLANLPGKNSKSAKDIIEVALDPQVAFSFMVRYWRLRHGWTQKEAAEKMGFGKIYSYQRLESHKCNPSLKIITLIKKIYPEFSLDQTITL